MSKKRLWTRAGIAMFALLVVMLPACGGGPTDPTPDGGDGDGGGGNGGTPITAGPGTIVGSIGVPAGVSMGPGDTSVYVLGQAAGRVAVQSDGSFVLPVDTAIGSIVSRSVTSRGIAANSTPDDPGYQLIVESDDGEYGQKVDGVQVTDDGPTQLSEPVQVEPTGNLMGTVTLSTPGFSPVGIVVYIPGTSYDARTDANGFFFMSNIPPGDYPYLRAERDGFLPALIRDVTVPSGGTKTVPTAMLQVDAGDSATVLLNRGRQYSTTRRVPVSIIAPTATTFRYYEGTADGVTYQPFDSDFMYEFSSDGSVSLSFDFQNANGSNYYSNTYGIIIDTNPTVSVYAPSGSIADSTPVVQWIESPIEAVEYRVQVVSSGDPDNPIVDEIATGDSLDLADLDAKLEDGGSYIARVAVVDDLGNEFSFTERSFSIDFGDVTNLYPAPDSNVTSRRPTLTWSPPAVPNPRYLVTISTNVDLSDPVVELGVSEAISGEQYTVETDLALGTTYYYRITVVDESDVVGEPSYTESFTVPSPSMSLYVAGAIPSSDYGELFSEATVDVLVGTDVEITAQPGFTPSEVSWYLDGTPIDGVQGSNLTIGSALDLGTYQLTVVALDGTIPYSATLDLVVQPFTAQSVSVGHRTMFVQDLNGNWLLSGEGYSFASDELAGLQAPVEFVEVESEDQWAVGRAADGTVWAVGWNWAGLGNGNGESSVFVQVSGLSDIVDIAVGWNSGFALDSSGVLYGWGANDNGQLGLGLDGDPANDFDNQPYAVAIELGEPVVEVDAMNQLAAARNAAGEVISWGYNGNQIPTKVPGLTGVTSIATGSWSGFAIGTNGELWRWNAYDQNVWRESSLSGIVDIAVGSDHILALRSDGTVLSWGSNYSGQLGDGTKRDRWQPSRITALSNIQKIAAGPESSAAIDTDGTLWVWGANNNGQLALGDDDERLTPEEVSR